MQYIKSKIDIQLNYFKTENYIWKQEINKGFQCKCDKLLTQRTLKEFYRSKYLQKLR